MLIDNKVMNIYLYRKLPKIINQLICMDSKIAQIRMGNTTISSDNSIDNMKFKMDSTERIAAQC
mgnify:CR=1 FL=1